MKRENRFLLQQFENKFVFIFSFIITFLLNNFASLVNITLLMSYVYNYLLRITSFPCFAGKQSMVPLKSNYFANTNFRRRVSDPETLNYEERERWKLLTLDSSTERMLNINNWKWQRTKYALSHRTIWKNFIQIFTRYSVY